MIGRDQDRNRDAGGGELLDRFEPKSRRSRARLHLPREFLVQRRHGDRDLNQSFTRHRREDVDVARDQRGFRHYAHGVIGARQRFEHAPHDAAALFGRLVWIGVGADRQRSRNIARRRQFALQHLRRALLDENLGLEIEAGRIADIGVGGPRVAIDAAMLAAAIGIDRAVEADVGRVVARDDASRLLYMYIGLERGQVLQRAPSVVDLLAREGLEAPACIRHGAASAPSHGIDFAGRFRQRLARRTPGGGAGYSRRGR